MDLLTDILNTAGLRGRLLHQQSLYQPWALTFPCPQSMGFHVITQGRAYLWPPDTTEPMLLERGDIAFMARGNIHHISTHPNKKLLHEVPKAPIAPEPQNPQSAPLLTLVSGAYQLWHDPIHPLFTAFPDWQIIRANSMTYGDAMQQALQLLSGELKSKGLGSEGIVSSMLDVLFNLILRRILRQEQDKYWGSTLGDPILVQALQLMHQAPEKDWTVESLANSVGLSRSGFALKFKQSLGDSPLHYLTTLRMFKATDMLANTDFKLDKIAQMVGYKDAFGFSKTFKRLTGLSPNQFRKKNASEKALSWRFS